MIAVGGTIREYRKSQSSSTSYLFRSLRLARRALMIRVLSSSFLLLIVYAMSSTLPKLLLASRNRRDSESEWSKSSPSKPSGSRNAVAASSNDTPCLRQLLWAFRRSQSNMNYELRIYNIQQLDKD